MPALTVHNAEIKTAAVEIKTLTISGKQVTLAVFRQLQEVDWLDDLGHQRGTAWGTVNYHPDKCADATRRHVHVVWQDGADLRRSAVHQPRLEEDGTPVHVVYGEEAGHLEHASFLKCTSNNPWGSTRRYVYRDLAHTLGPTTDNGVAIKAGQIQDCPMAINNVSEKCVFDYRAVMHGSARAMREVHAWGAVTALPQLFIAV